MIVLITLIVSLGLLALLVGSFRYRSLRKKLKEGQIKEMPKVEQVDTECCGQHEVCEKDSLLAAVSKDIEYYDDEELDAYKGKDADEYTEKEVEEFRDILYTTKDDEVAGWVRSLQLRGIQLPTGIKDEVFLIIGERRG